jgi:metallophosphoesterase superfamily enzyme
VKRGTTVVRPCFVADSRRLILPALGAYTGGLYCDHPDLQALMQPRALAVLTGATCLARPMR